MQLLGVVDVLSAYSKRHRSLPVFFRVHFLLTQSSLILLSDIFLLYKAWILLLVMIGQFFAEFWIETLKLRICALDCSIKVGTLDEYLVRVILLAKETSILYESFTIVFS